MAEYWKSTPKYWCKHCSVYVRDTKLERQNHDATAKHQGAVKRALRDLHRGHEKEEREKGRARREIERLNGVVSSSSSAATGSTTTPVTAASSTTSRLPGASSTASPRILPESERKRQAEQLASLGVSLPDEFRRDLAMAGDWQVTSTTIVQEIPDDDTGSRPGAAARGVHKRERTDDELEAEEAVKGLFKKPRRWGRDPRTVGGDGDGTDLDALLSEGLTVKKKDEEDVKEEHVENEDVTEEDDSGPPVKIEEEQQQRDNHHELPRIKKELSDEAGALHDDAAAASANVRDAGAEPESPRVKIQHGDGGPEPAGGSCAPAVVFKKRKPKNIRQK